MNAPAPPTPPADGAQRRRQRHLDHLRANLGAVIRGRPDAIELLLVGLLSGGHVLIEDVPGVGKTTLAKALARSLDLTFTRVQFTPDLLPADILGGAVLDVGSGAISFHRGPVFTQVLLADEINRASPRTQSALLEAMNERQITVDGETRPLPSPFFVVATQNPVDFQGTYPLPEAQLDRFMLVLSIGYPREEDELEVLFARQTDDPLDHVEPIADVTALVGLHRAVQEVRVERDVARYLLRVVRATRHHPDLSLGVSPRGSLALFRAAQAHALLAGRSFASPEDIHGIAGPVLSHRLMLSPKARYGGRTEAAVIDDILAEVEVPA